MIACMVPTFAAKLWVQRVLNAFEFTGGIILVILFITSIALLLSMGTRTPDTDLIVKNLTWGLSGWENKAFALAWEHCPRSSRWWVLMAYCTCVGHSLRDPVMCLLAYYTFSFLRGKLHYKDGVVL